MDGQRVDVGVDDPLGFRVALPPGWTRASDGRAVCFRDPGSLRFLRVRESAANPGRYEVDTAAADPNDHLMRLIVAGETPTAAAICWPVQRWRRRASMVTTVAAGVGLCR